MITSDEIEQQTKVFLKDGGSITVVEGFREVKIEKISFNNSRYKERKKPKAASKKMTLANKRRKEERERKIKLVLDELEKNSDLNWRELLDYIKDSFKCSESAASKYITDAKRLLSESKD